MKNTISHHNCQDQNGGRIKWLNTDTRTVANGTNQANVTVLVFAIIYENKTWSHSITHWLTFSHSIVLIKRALIWVRVHCVGMRTLWSIFCPNDIYYVEKQSGQSVYEISFTVFSQSWNNKTNFKQHSKRLTRTLKTSNRLMGETTTTTTKTIFTNVKVKTKAYAVHFMCERFI